MNTLRFAAVVLCAAGMTLRAASLEAQSGPADPTGVWNIQSDDMTARATGGVRIVLLRVEEADRQLQADITSIRNTFMPVDEIRYEGSTMYVTYGSYAYTLRVEGDRLAGTLTSPLGTQDVTGQRQHKTLMYVGDEGAEFRTERTGTLGVATDPSGPANDDPNPKAWVTSRIGSVDDLALLNGRARVPVQFANARAHEAKLRELAGARVTVVGTWVGDKILIESIAPAAP